RRWLRPACRTRGCSWRRGWLAAPSRSQARWPTRNWLHSGLGRAARTAYAELAALRPRAGGEYVYLRAAYGRLAAFLTGWTSFVAGFSGAIAAAAVVLASYVGRFVPGVCGAQPLFVIPVPE